MHLFKVSCSDWGLAHMWLGIAFLLALGLVAATGEGSVTRKFATVVLLSCVVGCFCLVFAAVYWMAYLGPGLPPSTYKSTMGEVPVFFCFQNVANGSAGFDVFMSAPLVRLCDSAPCPARVRICAEGESPLDTFRDYVAPVTLACLGVALVAGFVEARLKSKARARAGEDQWRDVALV